MDGIDQIGFSDLISHLFLLVQLHGLHKPVFRVS